MAATVDLIKPGLAVFFWGGGENTKIKNFIKSGVKITSFLPFLGYKLLIIEMIEMHNIYPCVKLKYCEMKYRIGVLDVYDEKLENLPRKKIKISHILIKYCHVPVVITSVGCNALVFNKSSLVKIYI